MKNTQSYKSYIKSPYKSLKHSTYFHSYDHFFNKYRNKAITFVEVGVANGGSLYMWRDYFGPNARIIGIDLNPNVKKFEKDGFEIFIGNQLDEDFWNYFKSKVGGIDILLDDGGHNYDQQIVTMECLIEGINDGGVLLVEDTHTSYFDGYGPRDKTFIEYVKQKIDLVNMRFSKFSKKKSENRFWSIEVVESMVAFKIFKEATNLISEPTLNNGKDDGARDHRLNDSFYISKFEKYFKNIKFIKYIPYSIKIAKFIKNKIANRKFAAKKFFK